MKIQNYYYDVNAIEISAERYVIDFTPPIFQARIPSARLMPRLSKPQIR
jgi:hypothetical protein